jgi:diaminopimelate decarboxylase
VIDIKSSFGIQYIVLDGGTNIFNIDAHYYGFKSLPFSVLTDNPNKYDVYTICGPLCTSTDRLAVDIHCRVPNIGDTIAFYQAGAYGFSASPGLFLSRGFPKEIFYEPKE